MRQFWSGDGIYILIATIIMLLGLYQLWLSPRHAADVQSAEYVEVLPDFSRYQDVNEKKAQFFNFLLPRIQNANQREQERRAFLRDVDTDQLSSTDEAQLYALAKRYRVDLKGVEPKALVSELLSRVDQVPASLILAQAANESAWGTSRFAREGNNLFGLWCFTRGCGLTPKQRDAGAKHEVEKFHTVQDSVNKYVRTINSHPAYQKLRKIRKELRNDGETLTGFALAAGLTNYSERGQEYIDEIQSMISFNELERFNRSE